MLKLAHRRGEEGTPVDLSSEPTAPRQAAQKKIVETKIHLSSQYDNLDLEKIMASQYPALQLVPPSGGNKWNNR